MAYVFRVAAVNGGGTGAFSGNSTSVTPVAPAVVPGAPSAVAGIPGNGSVALSWTAPASNGGAAISDYTVQYSSNGGTSWITFTHAASAATTTTVNGLTNGTNYIFRVAAVNGVSTGSFSAASGAVVPSATVPVPAAPTNAAVAVGSGSLVVTWTAPANSTAVANYIVQYSTDSGNTWTTGSTVNSTTTSATLSGLTNGVSYWIRVGSTNSAGTTFGSMTIPVIPVASPSTNEMWHNASSGYAMAIWTAVDQYGVGKGPPVVLSPGQTAFPIAFTGGSKTLYIAVAPSRNLTSGWYTVVDPNLRVTVADAKQLTFWFDGWVGTTWQLRVNNTRSVSMYPA